MKYFSFVLFLLFCASANSQTSGSVKGFVYDKANGEPVPFSNVYFKGTTIGANTDLNGFYNINRIPPGDYVLTISNLDYDTIREKVTINAGEILNKNFYANKGGIKLQEIE